MAKYRRYRKYSRRSYGKWAANIQEISNTILTLDQGVNYTTYTLAFNPTQLNTAVSQTFTVKNFEISSIINIPLESGGTLRHWEDFAAYIMFVPQGMNVTASYNNEHPEYIMAYKFLGKPGNEYTTTGQQFQPVKVKSRLSRKLQSGDSIILFLKWNYTNPEFPATQPQAELHGLYRWWTKAN